MRFTTVLRAGAVALAMVFSVLSIPGIARADGASSDDWNGKVHVDVTPYIYLPTLNATFRYRLSDFQKINGAPIATDLSQTIDTTVGPNSYLANLNFALMGNATLRMGKMALYGDVLNANLNRQSSKVFTPTGPLGNVTFNISAQTQQQVVTTMWTIAPSFTVYHDKNTSADFLLGGRFVNLSANANFQLSDAMGNTYSAGAARKDNYGDFIIGSYGQFGLGGHWSAPYYIDYGFGTPSTWQGIIGVKYGQASLSWRYVRYNAGTSTALLQSFSMGGPQFGYTFKF